MTAGESDIKYGIQNPRPGGPILLLRLGILTEQGEGSSELVPFFFRSSFQVIYLYHDDLIYLINLLFTDVGP